MILIVDDRQENLYSLKKLLEIHNFSVDTALSGEEALKKILRHHYALVILDVQMPGMDGFEVAEAITGYGKTKDIPILFLSAVKIDKAFITKGYDSGGIDYVTKPFDPDVLLLKVKTFYRLSEQRNELNDIQAALREEIQTRKRAERELSDLNHSLEQRVAERTEELFRINRELELSNNDLQQYASVASHDLKEPLRKIQIYSDRVRKEFLEGVPGGKAYIDKIISSSNRLTTLINDLLNYSKLSADGLFQVTDLNEIINELLSDLEFLIAEKNARIKVDTLPAMEVIPGQMRQLFQNLISNSLKFSQKNIPPEISISSETFEEKDNVFCKIRIGDNGIGFNETYKDKIFAMFQRLHSRTSYEGNGIGLAIVKKIVEKHNGEVSVQSQEGSGTVFSFIFPMHQSPINKSRTVSVL